KVSKVQVKGEFNNWNATGSDFDLVDGVFQKKIELSPGKYQYLFVVDNEEVLDPFNPLKIDNNIGGVNSLLTIDDNQHLAPYLLTHSFDYKYIDLKVDNHFQDLMVYWNNKFVHGSIFNEDSQILKIPIPNEAADYHRSYIRVYASNEHGMSNDVLIPLEFKKVVTSTSKLTRFDKHTQIMYFLMVDRFANGNLGNDAPINSPEVHPRADYHGGDLAGVLRKINDGYFEQLGCNTIWLSPITQNPTTPYGLWPNPKTKFSGYHGYWPISSCKIDFHFGNDSDLLHLVQTSHQKNMNVILDYVANHVHEDHPAIKANPHWKTNLFLPDGTMNTEKWDEHRLTTWFDTFLPTLDLSNPEVIEPMSDSALYWIKTFDLDGFRHDATKHIHENFWRTLTSKLKNNVDYPIYQVGETYGSRQLIKSYIGAGMLDAQFDFNVYDDAVATFAKKSTSFERLSTSLHESFKYYGYHNLMGYITGNQDRARVISYASGDVQFDEDAKEAGWTRQIDITDSSAFNKVLQLFAFNFTIPGIPCIYYGDEIGMPGGNDPDNRRMMRFDNLTKREKALRTSVSKLALTRSNNMALLYGDFKELMVNDSCWVYQRTYFDNKAIVLFNKSEKPAELNLSLPSVYMNSTALFNTDYSLETTKLDITIPPNGIEIILSN
ncbi:MAG: alpha-amylase family glycosyl hydrolase, partial [Bacteroidales bacterium]|nr:alpha-amylase family glycosyl hydrolase [Bacteroidales bacterium]